MELTKRELAVSYWAERTVKAKAFDMAKSMHNKRNTFIYSDSYAAKTCGLSVDEFLEARRAFIAANPMRYAPTTGRFVYLASAAANA